MEEAVRYLRELEELVQSPGYNRLRELADAVAFGAYTKWASGPAVQETESGPVIMDRSEYCRGQIAGLESLFQNVTENIATFKEYVADLRKSMRLEVEGGY